MDLKAIKGIGPATEEKLNDAGVDSVTDLASADAAALADATGISETRISDWMAQAQELASDAGARDGPGEAAEAEAPPAEADDEAPADEAPTAPAATLGQKVEEFKVVLRDRAHTARVKIGETWHDNVPIVTARLQESEERIMEGLRHNAVLLKERAHTAYVKIGDTWHEGVPIFKQRGGDNGEDASDDEVRVRVDEIREKRPRGGGLAQKIRNLFKR